MRLTPLGKAALLLIALTLWNAVNSGLNTLYLVYSALVAMVGISWIGVRFAALAVRLEIVLPEQVFCDDRVPLRLRITNRLPLPLQGITVISREGTTPLGNIPARKSLNITLPYRFSRRGINLLTDVQLEMRFPFGLFVRRYRVEPHRAIAFPGLSPIVGKPRAMSATLEEVARPRRGAGDEFWGVREFVPGDDARLISWRLSAKMGRPVIREYAEMVGDRVIIRVSGSPSGEATEQRIREAASLARYYIDEGAEVRLVTDEADIDYGRGLVHLTTMLEHLALVGEGKQPRPTGEPPPASQPLPAPTSFPLLYWALYALAATIAVGLQTVKGLDPITRVIVPLALPVGWLMDRGRLPHVPAGVLTPLNILAIAFILAVDVPTQGLLMGLTHLLCYALINRLVSPKGPRDGGLLALISFLLFLLISWQSIDPIYLAVYVSFLAALGVWLAASSGFALGGIRRWGAQGLATLLALMLTSAVFAATPRLANPHFAKMMRQLGLTNVVAPEFSIVKLADRVTLGIFDDVRTDARRVMQVKVTGVDIPAGGGLYIRGSALDTFDGKEWRRTQPDFQYRFFNHPNQSSEGRAFYEQQGPLFATPACIRDGKSVIEEFYLYPMATPIVFSIGDPTAIGGDIAFPTYDIGGTIFDARPHESGAHYIVYSQSPEIRADFGIIGYDQFLKTTFLALPDTDDIKTVRRMAKEIVGEITDPSKQAEALEKYFHEHFYYSSQREHHRQSLDEFLTSSRSANCEYFATAMALMLRSLGVPARLAIGYLSTERKQVGEYFDVRNSDGHAWVEAYIPGRGWFGYDPTANVLAPQPTSSFLGQRVSLYLLDLQMSWYRYVIGYDFYLQQDVFARIIAVWRNVVAVIALVVAIVALAAVVWAALRTYLSSSPARSALLPAAASFREVERVLARYGFRRPPWQTPSEFSQAIIAVQPQLSIMEKLTRAYYRWRYTGEGKEVLPRLLLELRTLLRRFREASMR